MHRTEDDQPIFTDAAIIDRETLKVSAHSADHGQGRVQWNMTTDEVRAIASLVRKVDRAGNAHEPPGREASIDPTEGIQLQGYNFIVGRSGDNFGENVPLILLISKDEDTGRTLSTATGRKNGYIRATEHAIFVAMCPMEVARQGAQIMEGIGEWIDNSMAMQ